MPLLAILAGLPQVSDVVVVGRPPQPGTVAIEWSGDPEDQPFVDAVRGALTRRLFVILPDPGHGRFVAAVAVERRSAGTVATPVPVPPASVGLGLHLTLPTKKTRLTPLVVTTLSVRLLSRADRLPVWIGSAVTVRVAGTSGESDAALAGDLANAAMRSFPNTAPDPASVP